MTIATQIDTRIGTRLPGRHSGASMWASAWAQPTVFTPFLARVVPTDNSTGVSAQEHRHR